MEPIRKYMCAVTASLLILCMSGCREEAAQTAGTQTAAETATAVSITEETRTTGEASMNDNAFERGVWMYSDSVYSEPMFYWFDGNGSGAWRWQSTARDREDIDKAFTYTRTGDTLELEWKDTAQGFIDRLLFGERRFNAEVKLTEPGVVEYTNKPNGTTVRRMTYIEDTDLESLRYYNYDELKKMAALCYMNREEDGHSPSYVGIKHSSGSICKIHMYFVYQGSDDGVPNSEMTYYIDFFTGKGHDEAGNEIDLLEYS